MAWIVTVHRAQGSGSECATSVFTVLTRDKDTAEGVAALLNRVLSSNGYHGLWAIVAPVNTATMYASDTEIIAAFKRVLEERFDKDLPF